MINLKGKQQGSTKNSVIKGAEGAVVGEGRVVVWMEAVNSSILGIFTALLKGYHNI